MDNLFEYFGHENQLWTPCTFADRDYVETSEISSSLEKAAHNSIHLDKLGQWILGNERSESSQELPYRLRIVWIERDFEHHRNNISSKAFEKIIQAFHLDLAASYYSTAFAGAAAFPVAHSQYGDIRSYSFCNHPKFAILWSRKACGNLIQVVCFGTAGKIAKLKQLLDVRWKFEDHDMAPAFLCCINLSTDLDHSHASIKQNIREVEVRTGHHKWSSRRESPALGDLSALLATVGGCETKLASCSRKTKVIQDLTEFILEHLEADGQLPSTMHTEAVGTQYQASCTNESRRLLEKGVRLVQKRVKMQQIDIEFFEVRIKTQLNAISSIISQNDTLLSHEVARDSKIIAIASQHDSSSMKILAVVTIVFLPGTFVSGVLSMPLMSWRPPLSIYWAITVPLTTMTLLAWRTWTVLQHRGRKHENEVAAATFGDRRSLSEVGMLLEKKRAAVGLGRISTDQGFV